MLPELLQCLPDSLHSRAFRYQSPLSAYQYVLGRLLLKHGLDSLGYNDDLEQVEILDNGKPSLSDVHFNISHSGHKVVCAFAKEGQIGVDIEKIKPIDFEDFTAMFSSNEWKAINASDDSTRSFYWFWTRKESIIKALGLTLKYLHQIKFDVSADHVDVNGKRWFLRDLDFGDGFMGAVCCEEEIGGIEFVEFLVAK